MGYSDCSWEMRWLPGRVRGTNTRHVHLACGRWEIRRKVRVVCQRTSGSGGQCLVIEERSGGSSGRKRKLGGPRCLGRHWQTGPHNYQSDRTARPADDLNIALHNVHRSRRTRQRAHHSPTLSEQETARHPSHSYTPTLPPPFASCGKPTSRSQTRTGHASAYPPSSMIEEVSITFYITFRTESSR